LGSASESSPSRQRSCAWQSRSWSGERELGPGLVVGEGGEGEVSHPGVLAGANLILDAGATAVAPLDHGDELGAPGFEAEAGVAAEEEIDQEAAAGQVPEPRRPAEPEQLPEHGEVTAPPDRETPERQELVRGRLRAASDGSPGEPPATALDRRALAHHRQAGGYKDETVSALAALACGEKVIERLTRDQVKRLARLLELAVAGRVSQRTLAGAVTRASRRYDLAKGAAELERWLREKAAEVGLLGRREAA
jgi:hypothetical protein